MNKTVDWYHEVFGMQIGAKNKKETHMWYGDAGGNTSDQKACKIAERVRDTDHGIDPDPDIGRRDLHERSREPRDETDLGPNWKEEHRRAPWPHG